jgi:hypothetical protein
MLTRARNEGGFLTVELVVAVAVISIAVLALMAAYEQAFFSLHSSAKSSSAGLIAENQLELYASLPYSSIGLDATALSTAKASDAYYHSDESALPLPSGGGGTDITISGCGTAANCLPVQTITGSDGQRYELETFIRSLTNPSETAWTERVVTVIARDLSSSGTKVVTIQTAFDHGPAS